MAMNSTLAYVQSIYAYFFSFEAARQANAQVKSELEHFKQKYDHKTVVFQYSSRINPPGLGDFALELICARFYSLIGIQVEFILEHGSKKNESWGILTERESIQRILEFEKLASRLLPSSVKFDVTDKIIKSSNTSQVLFFEESTNAQHDHNIFIMNLLRKIAQIYPNLAESMLLAHPPKSSIKQTEIGLHVRTSMNQKHRNPKIRRVLKDIYVLSRAFPQARIKIFGDEGVMDLISSALAQKRKYRDIELEFQKSKSYSEAFFESLECDFWFQRDGGGIGVASVFSRTPYLLISSQTIAARIYSISGSQYGPVANSNQVFLLNPFRGWYGDYFTYRNLRKIHF